MKLDLATYVNKNLNELAAEIKKERIGLGKFLVDLNLGKEKKTHLLRGFRKRIAILKTLMSQKKYLSSVN